MSTLNQFENFSFLENNMNPPSLDESANKLNKMMQKIEQAFNFRLKLNENKDPLA